VRFFAFDHRLGDFDDLFGKRLRVRFGALGSAGVSPPVSSATACCSSTFCSVSVSCACSFCPKPSQEKKPRFFFCHLRLHSSLFIHGAASSEAEK
jgi:hypothetical protein